MDYPIGVTATTAQAELSEEQTAARLPTVHVAAFTAGLALWFGVDDPQDAEARSQALQQTVENQVNLLAQERDVLVTQVNVTHSNGERIVMQFDH